MGLADILAKKRAAALLPKPTVKMYVALFNANPRLLYINYFENYKLLIDWLGKPEDSGERGTIPRMLSSYEVQEIALHLGVNNYCVWIEAYRQVDSKLLKAE